MGPSEGSSTSSPPHAAGVVSLDVSIVVCTRNRGQALRHTLSSITEAVRQSPGTRVEAVIVDNGSTDDTAVVIESWRGEQAFDVKLVREARQGLSRARNAGCRAAVGRILAMTDDDCRVRPDYLRCLLEAYSAQTAPCIIGGRIELGDPNDLPITIKTDPEPQILPRNAFPGGFIAGANLSMARTVFDLVGDFDERFGAGATFVAAEDTDFLFRASSAGVAVKYDPRIVVDHFHGRRLREKMSDLYIGYYYGDGALYAKHLLDDRRIILAIYKDTKNLFRDIMRPKYSPLGFKRVNVFKARHRAQGFFAFLMKR